MYKYFSIIILWSLFFISSVSTLHADYRVGVNYHSTTANFSTSSFLTQYHKPEVRATVLAQLTDMAKSGVFVINTRIWLTDPATARFPKNTERHGFPLSTQELANLRQYVKDVVTIKTNNNKPLDLYITLLWNGCADFKSGYDVFCHYSWSQYVQIAKTSIDQILVNIGDLTRTDGLKAVRLFYFDGEVMSFAKVNQNIMLTDVYPYFVQSTKAHGLTPTLYFSIVGSNDILDNAYIDPEYPALNGHKSLFWVYRTIEFMKQNNLYVPNKIDLSFYPDLTNSITINNIVTRVLNDMQVLYPDNIVGIAETYYPQDSVKRRELGLAFANYANNHTFFNELLFWTTPDSGGTGVDAGFPFDIASYYLFPPPTPIPSDKTGDINSDGSVDMIDIGILIDNYNKTPIPNIRADINSDNSVDIIDLGIIIDNYVK